MAKSSTLSLFTDNESPIPGPTIGVTGSRYLSCDGYTILNHFEESLSRAKRGRFFTGSDFIHINGVCLGVDGLVGRQLFHRFGIRVHGIVPPRRFAVVPDWQEWCETHELIEPGRDDFKRRNQRIVDLSDRLIAFPLYPEDHPESRRSGTWQTIRMARRKGIMADADIHILSQIARRHHGA